MQQARESMEAEAADRARRDAETKAAKRGENDDQIAAKGYAAAATAVPKPTAQRIFTDPEARIMKTGQGSFEYCYNGQAVVDAEYQVIVATELNSVAVDIQQLIPMVDATHDTLGVMPAAWSADAGYCSKANLDHTTALEADHDTEFFISTRRMKHHQPIPAVPQGSIPEDVSATQRMVWRLKINRGKAIYARCKSIVEPAFGQIDTRQGKHLLLRGLPKVSKEWDLLAGCHNLLKLFTYRAATA